MNLLAFGKVTLKFEIGVYVMSRFLKSHFSDAKMDCLKFEKYCTALFNMKNVWLCNDNCWFCQGGK